jgi:hypothetical protein
MVFDSHHLDRLGWALATIRPHCQPGGPSVCAGSCLGLLLIMMLIIAYWWVQDFSSFGCGGDIVDGGRAAGAAPCLGEGAGQQGRHHRCVGRLADGFRVHPW